MKMWIVNWLTVVLVVTGCRVLQAENPDQVFHRRSTRDASISSHAVQPPYNVDKDSRFVEMVMVVDNLILAKLDFNETSVKRVCMYITSLLNPIMEPLNIFVVLTDVVILEDGKAFNVSSSPDETLQSFQIYRKNVLTKAHPNDYAVYLSSLNFTRNVLGDSSKAAICSTSYSSSIIFYENNLRRTATVMAHELGHSLGMEHDLIGCYCPDAYCIMAAIRYGVPNHWSICSIDSKNLFFKRGHYECLKNVPDRVFVPKYCGNGFLEPGEECDCGLAEYCKNPCCDPFLCVLRKNATCATGKCCDLSTCSVKSAGEICRETNGECDLPEHCTGGSEYCPEDVFKRNSEECGDKKAFCYQGMCQSHDSQCQLTRAASATTSPSCYSRNTIGRLNADCGYDYLTNKSTPCLPGDEQCGRLHCENVPETFDYAKVWNKTSGYTFYQSKVVRCNRVAMDLGPQVRDPGLVPNGAKCGLNKMCLDAKCVEIGELREKFPECPDCLNGVCNSKGHCHCSKDWGGDECNAPGSGGSSDSGPLTNDEEPRSFTKIMFIVFLGVVPCCAAFAVLLMFWKYRYSQMNGSPYAVSG